MIPLPVKQIVAVQGSLADKLGVNADVPLWLKLDSLLFLIYINDFVDGVRPCFRLFDDNIFLYMIVEDPGSVAYMVSTDVSKMQY